MSFTILCTHLHSVFIRFCLFRVYHFSVFVVSVSYTNEKHMLTNGYFIIFDKICYLTSVIMEINQNFVVEDVKTAIFPMEPLKRA